MVIIGDLRDLRGEVVNFEWKIKDFLQLSDKNGTRYESPKFTFCDRSWEIWIFPNGDTYDVSIGYISLYVILNSLNDPITVDYSLHFETVDGRADTDAKWSQTRNFTKAKYGWGRAKFIARSKLIEKKSELLPTGVLIVTCTLKNTGTGDGADCATVDEFTQTEEESESATTVEEFTQTEEETGSATNVDEFTHSEKETGVYKLQKHFGEILENGNVSDVVLKVKDREFKSHRCVLAARSPVFLAMMTHNTKEKNTGVVDIQDVDSNTFSYFLKYLYTGNEQIITPANVVKLYIAADKYQVDELKKSCLDYMLKNISVDNFCDILSLSLDHVERDLTDACSQFFIENIVAIISTSTWLTFIDGNPVAGNELHLKHLKNTMKDKN